MKRRGYFSSKSSALKVWMFIMSCRGEYWDQQSVAFAGRDWQMHPRIYIPTTFVGNTIMRKFFENLSNYCSNVDSMMNMLGLCGLSESERWITEHQSSDFRIEKADLVDLLIFDKFPRRKRWLKQPFSKSYNMTADTWKEIQQSWWT
jgi:hypothetical protein